MSLNEGEDNSERDGGGESEEDEEAAAEAKWYSIYLLY